MSSETNNSGVPKHKYGAAVAALPLNPTKILDSSWQEAFEDLDDEWKLTGEMKEALHKSPWLQTELQDGGLQHLLTKIAAASRNTSFQNVTVTEQEQVLQQTKESNPAFAAFLDKAMVAAGILVREGKEADSPVEEWLKKTHEGTLNVSLKPLPRRQQMYTKIERTNAGSQSKDGEEEAVSSSEDSEEDSDEESASSTSGDSSSDDDK